MADRWSCASTTEVPPRGRLCSTYRGGAPVRLGSRGLAWSHCTSWISQRCGRIEPRAQARLAIRLGPHIGLDERSQVGAIEVQQRDGSVVLLIEGSTVKASKPCRAI